MEECNEFNPRRVVGWTSFCTFLVLNLFFAVAYLEEEFSVWKAVKDSEVAYTKAECAKKVKVLESLANLEAAKNKALADVTRAKGTAESNKIVSHSICPTYHSDQYLKYLWIQALERTAGQVIYVPTESGIPVLEQPKRK